ncbi:MAG: ABC transporter ATP-binding protein [Velocimicrobium sp.]
MQNTLKHMITRIKEGMLQEMWTATKWVYQYAKHHWKAMIFYTLIGLTGTVVSLGSSLVSKNLIDMITGHQSSLLIKTFSLYIGLSIGNILLTQISNYASNWISIKVDNEIKSDIFNKMLITDWESITAYHTGDLLTRWSSDASTISSGILNWVPNLIIYIIKFVSTLAVVMYYDKTFALFALLGIPVSIVMSRSLLHRMQSNNKKSAAMNAKMSGFNQEVFSNIQTIKAFDLIRIYSQHLKQLQRDYLEMKMDFQKLSMITSSIMALVGIAVSYSCYGWGIYRVWSGAITYGTMTLFLNLSSSLTGTLNSLISLVPTAISITTSAGRLMDILTMPKEDYSDEEAVDELYRTHQKDGISLSLHALNYSYHTGTKVFEDACLKAHPHEIIALIGPSGEGKTTLLRILLSLLQPQGGECVLYGSEDFTPPLPLSPSTRKLFSYVPQGNTMFSGTIAENMRNVKPDATDEEITSSLRAACAWEFIEKLPDGIYSKIGERGGGFSEGQSQRLSIARAFLRKSPILLLDEATSALDIATEQNVLKNFMQDKYPRTCIITTHRLSVLSICNKAYSLHDNKCNLMTKEEISDLIQMH